MQVTDLDPASIADAGLRAQVVVLLNLVETVLAELGEAKAEIQRLRDENNRLKGEQGKPAVKANTPRPAAPDHASERERRTPQAWTKGSKVALLPVRVRRTP